MSIYLYSIRAKTVAIKTGEGLVHAHTLEMLHTNWRGMADDSDCPRSHRLAQVNAERYWDRQGALPTHVILGDKKEGKLYRWTGKTCFWIDTDLVPGEFLGTVKDGVLTPHDCSQHPRQLIMGPPFYVNTLSCGECHKKLEAKPGEIDAIRAKDAEERLRGEERQQKIEAIWAKAREQRKKLSEVQYKAADLVNVKRFWEVKISGMARELDAAKISLDKVSVMCDEAKSEVIREEVTLVHLEAAARFDVDQLCAAEGAGVK